MTLAYIVEDCALKLLEMILCNYNCKFAFKWNAMFSNTGDT